MSCRRLLSSVSPALGLVLVLTAGLGPAAYAASPAAPAPSGQQAPADLQAEAARTAAALTEATVRYERGLAVLEAVRLRGAGARSAAGAAMAQSSQAKAQLARLVGVAYRNPRPGPLVLALAQPGHLADAVQAQVSLEQVQGSQQDVLRTAVTEGVRAQALVREADRLAATATEQSAVLAAEVAQLQRAATDSQVRLEAAAARAQADQAARDASARASRSRTPGAVAPPAVTGPVGSCGGGTLTGYGNGLLPASALCPLAGTAGLLLRADAAAAFNRMTAAGGMPCAGNSYRSYGEQVALYRVKPGLAAVPGTSNHGWGVAVDFACGADRFGSPGYRWLVANGPTYGWTHPSWAEQGGPRPEPWHWEYTG